MRVDTGMTLFCAMNKGNSFCEIAKNGKASGVRA